MGFEYSHSQEQTLIQTKTSWVLNYGIIPDLTINLSYAEHKLADTFKHVAKSIIGQGAVLRKLVNLGERQLPSAHFQHHTHGRCGFH